MGGERAIHRENYCTAAHLARGERADRDSPELVRTARAPNTLHIFRAEPGPLGEPPSNRPTLKSAARCARA